jgi:predicted nuclease of predicted toxin-antitoxin system
VKRLLLDQGLPRSTGAILARVGWEVVHVSEISMARADDIAILERATIEQRVCVTLDADFHALLALSGETAPSVVRIRKEGLDADALAALLESVWSDIESAVIAGAMVTITDRSVRIRRLPIGRREGKASEQPA